MEPHPDRRLHQGDLQRACVVSLSIAPRVLTDGGVIALAAASIVRLASWVMICSGTLIGQIADRFGRADLILRLCPIGGMVSLTLLSLPEWAIRLASPTA